MNDVEFVRLWRQWVAYLEETWGIDPRFGYLVGLAQTVTQFNGYPRGILIVSGYRSPKRQLELQNRWDSGDRVGLVARPASRSWHMQGLAVDVNTREQGFPFFRDIMLQLPGVRWGGNFNRKDNVHFDLPIGKPLSIQQLLSS